MLYQGGVDGFDIEYFKQQFAKHGGKITSEAAFEFPPGAARADITSMAQQQMPQFMAKMKTDGVTSVIVLLDGRNGLIPALPAATSQEFFPEWVNGQFPQRPQHPRPATTTRSSGRTRSGSCGSCRPVAARTIVPFDWYWGPDKGSHGRVRRQWSSALYQRIHLAGPDLTAAKMKPGALKGNDPSAGTTATACSPPRSARFEGRRADPRLHARMVEHRHRGAG